MKIQSVIKIIFLLALTNNLFSQENEKMLFHFDVGIVGTLSSTGKGGNMSLTVINNRNWSFSGEMSYIGFQVNNVPSNYNPPGFFSSSAPPKDEFASFGFLLGKRLQESKSSPIIIPKAGITFNEYSKAEFESYESGTLFGWGNSTTTYSKTIYPNKKRNIGLIGRIDLLFPFSKKIGVMLNLNGNLNKHKSYFGGGFSVIVGRLR